MPQTKRVRSRRDLSTIHPDTAAIDIGATMHVAAVGPDLDTEPVRTFQSFTDDLHRLADWFARCEVKTVAMESTGVYWIPVFEILEQRGFEVMVVNARDAKAPRKIYRFIQMVAVVSCNSILDGSCLFVC
jgi:transposase